MNNPPRRALHEDAAKIMQEVCDLKDENDRQRRELEKWEREAKLAQGKVVGLETELARTVDERDHWHQRFTQVITKLEISAKVILDCINPSERLSDNGIVAAVKAAANDAPPKFLLQPLEPSNEPH